MQTARGTITLIGSGEFGDGMARVYRTILSRTPSEPHAVFLDTPAGFELGSDQISSKARDYFERHLNESLEIASFKNKQRANALQVENALRVLLGANFILAGPGSPTYIVRNWQATPIWESVLYRFQQGAHLVFASAAAIAMSASVLPVYEIYKAGADLHWSEGLDLFRAFDMQLAVVPHWNNSEGAHDTRFCYMGAERFHELETLLPQGTTVLGIDEHTACLFEPDAETCRVMGAGRVTIRCDGQEWSYATGQTFPFGQLQNSSPRTSGPVQTAPMPLDPGNKGETTRYLVHLARALDEVNEPDAKRTLIDRAHDTMHELSAGWLETSHSDTVQAIAPFIETLIDIRSRLREAKQFALADEIRQRLLALGIELQDSSTGTTWHKIIE